MALIDLLEGSWIIFFLISIVFIFLIIIRELGDQTRGIPTWRRIPYGKMLPRISLTAQHFTRKGELLSNTSSNICRSIRRDLINYLHVMKGYSIQEMKELLSNKEELLAIFNDDEIVLFLLEPIIWSKKFQLEESLLSKILSPLKIIFKSKSDEVSRFYIELALIINKTRKIIETSS